MDKKNNLRKRDRAPNFVSEEKLLLLDLVRRHQGILENKRTDAVTVDQKKQQWETLAKEFNQQNIHVHRSATQLKNYYEHAKHDAKKELAEDRVSFNFDLH
jgi:Myb/SANT-like DNA-binding domain